MIRLLTTSLFFFLLINACVSIYSLSDDANHFISKGYVSVLPDERVVVMGDTHGDYKAFIKALKLAGAVNINQPLKWLDPQLKLVMVGDVLDRHKWDGKTLDYLLKLKKKVPKNLIFVLGNHEIMNFAGDLRYVFRGGFEYYHHLCNDQIPRCQTDFKKYCQSHPYYCPGAEEEEHIFLKEFRDMGRFYAFEPSGDYATTMAPYGVMKVVGDSVYVHGGVLPIHLKYGSRGMTLAVFMGKIGYLSNNFANTQYWPVQNIAQGLAQFSVEIRDEYKFLIQKTPQQFSSSEKKKIFEFNQSIDKSLAKYYEAYEAFEGIYTINKDIESWLTGKTRAPSWLKSSLNPFWNRNFSISEEEYPKMNLSLQGICADAQWVLDYISKHSPSPVKRMIIGHTVQKQGINSICNDKVWRVDVGISEYYGGETQVLEIKNSTVKILK